MAKIKKSEPKCCPFCGTIDGIALILEDKVKFMQCPSCFTSGPIAKSSKKALKKWNKRIPVFPKVEIKEDQAIQEPAFMEDFRNRKKGGKITEPMFAAMKDFIKTNIDNKPKEFASYFCVSYGVIQKLIVQIKAED